MPYDVTPYVPWNLVTNQALYALMEGTPQMVIRSYSAAAAGAGARYGMRLDLNGVTPADPVTDVPFTGGGPGVPYSRSSASLLGRRPLWLIESVNRGVPHFGRLVYP